MFLLRIDLRRIMGLWTNSGSVVHLSIVALVAFILYERRQEEPVLI